MLIPLVHFFSLDNQLFNLCLTIISQILKILRIILDILILIFLNFLIMKFLSPQQVVVLLTPVSPSLNLQNHPDDPELPQEKVPQVILVHQFDLEFETYILTQVDLHSKSLEDLQDEEVQ